MDEIAAVPIKERQISKPIARLTLACVLALLLLSACSRREAAVPQPLSLQWRQGDVEEAFTEAAAAQKPLLLYWGAAWCPPCNQLEATVFQRQDFIAQAQHFVTVHLDGDSPGAQRWGEHFGVVGYPTLIVFRADRTEVTRLSGSFDPQALPRALTLAQRQTRPVSELLELAERAPAQLQANDWSLLALYGWEVDEQRVVGREQAPALLRKLAQRCPDAAIRRHFELLALALDAEGEAPPLDDARRGLAIRMLRSMLANPDTVRREIDVLAYAGGAIVARLAAPRSATYGIVAQEMIIAMDRAADDATLSATARLAATLPELELFRRQRREGVAMPISMQDKARQRVQRADREARTPHERQTVINAAAKVLIAADLRSEAEELLRAELPRSAAPYYYMLLLADLARERGDSAEAIDWLRQAHETAQGPATRTQWSALYVQGLIELQPQDAATIEAATAQLLDEVAAAPGGYYQRTRIRLAELDRHLRDWGRTQHQQAVLSRLHVRLQPVCAKLEQNSEARDSCTRFLAAG